MEIKLNGKVVNARDGETILEVATREGVEIPTLCYLKQFSPTSSCRMCLVEVESLKNLVTACSYKVFDGMEIETDSDRVKNARKINLELLLSNHNYDCDNCVKSGDCELQKLAVEYDADPKRFAGEKLKFSIDDSSLAIVRDNSKCILCKKCVEVCSSTQKVDAIKQTNRGFKTKIDTAFERGLKNSSCVGCGQCVKVCPTGALMENRNITDVEKILNSKTCVKVVAPAPAVKVAIMEILKIKQICLADKLIPSIFRALGFDYVFDVSFGADLTVLEESKEFKSRLETGKNLPMFTSCCPAWIDYLSKFYPEIKHNASTCKSPLMMLGSVIKTYWAEKSGYYADNIKIVSVMPCTAKKSEITNTEDIDTVITVRELEYLLKKKNINIEKLTPSDYDSLLGESSGAGVIFGRTGGVMEATLRHIGCKDVQFEPYEDNPNIKIANANLGAGKIVVAVVSGLGNAKTIIEKIKSGELKVQFVEVMSCEGGCVNGGGMPHTIDGNDLNQRTMGLEELDKNKEFESKNNLELKKFIEWQTKSKNKAKLHVDMR